MRRILLWLMATVTVVVLLLGYHTSTEGASVSAGPPAVVSGSVAGTDTSRTATGPTPPKATGSAQKSAQKSTQKSTQQSTTSTVTGDTAQTEWGPVEVELTVEDGKITAVDVPVYPNGNGRDYEINSYALPQLVRETLSAQSAQIDMVSGATVTSDGYLQSLQSALDKGGL